MDIENEMENKFNCAISRMLKDGDCRSCREMLSDFETAYKRNFTHVVVIEVVRCFNFVCIVLIGGLIGNQIYEQNYLFAMYNWMLCTMNIASVLYLKSTSKDCAERAKRCRCFIKRLKEVLKTIEESK